MNYRKIVPFCSILFHFARYCKVHGFAGSHGTGHDGGGGCMNMRPGVFLSFVCAVSPVVVSAGGGQSHMDSVVHAFLFVKSGGESGSISD